MFLHTAFGSIGKGLERYELIPVVEIQKRTLRTFAISLQLRPASRIVLSLCSSSAVQGVLVLPFFLGVASDAVTAGSSPDVVVAIIAVELCGGDERLLRGFGPGA